MVSQAGKTVSAITMTYSTNSVNSYIKNLKLEKGNKATDWTPAPEDVDEGIANAQADIDTISDKTRSGCIETLSGSGFAQSTKTEDGGTTEVVVYGKSVQDGTPTPEAPVEIKSVTNPWIATSKNGVAFSKEVSCKVSVPVKTGEYFGYKTLYGSAQSQIMLMDENDKYIDWWTAYPEEKTRQYVYSKTIYGIRFYNTNTSGIPILFRNVTQGESYVYSIIRLTDIILRSTPDGTRDRLFKDSDGLWKIERNCAYISSYNGESITTGYYSNTGELSTGSSVVYALEAPTYETLPDNIQAELNTLTTYNPVTNVIVLDEVTPDIDVSFWTRDYRAKNTADSAASAANNAQTTANEAKAKAEAAQTAVSTKVETSVFNTLKNTVDENSANITSLTETVTTKADSSTVTTLSNTVNKVKQTADENSSSISSLTTTVNSKADGSKVTALENKTSTIEQNLSGVATRVTNLESENDGLDTRLTTAESKITDDAIVSTVTSSKTYKDALSGKVDTSVYNTKMEQLDDSISLKATATDVYTKTQANAAFDAKGSAATAKSDAISSAKSYTDTATTDMATKEYVTSQGYLTVTSDAITSKVSKNEVISAINQTAESVSINAEKINLTGNITFSSFDNSLQTTINNKAENSDLETVRTTANNAQTGVDSLNDSVFGVQTFEYVLNGVTIPAYKKEDGTYYYILNDEEVTVAESALVHDADGELTNYQEGGIYEDLGIITGNIGTIDAKVNGFDARETAIYDSIKENSLIARNYARFNNQSLIITNEPETKRVEDLKSYLQLKSDSINIYSNKTPAVAIGVINNSGYMEMRGTSLFIAQESRLSTVRLRSAEKNGKLALVAGSDGHVSLREVLD